MYFCCMFVILIRLSKITEGGKHGSTIRSTMPKYRLKMYSDIESDFNQFSCCLSRSAGESLQSCQLETGVSFTELFPILKQIFQTLELELAKKLSNTKCQVSRLEPPSFLFCHPFERLDIGVLS